MKTNKHTLKWKALLVLLLVGWMGIAQAQEPVQEQTQAQEQVQAQEPALGQEQGGERAQESELDWTDYPEWNFETSGHYKITSSKSLPATIELDGNLYLYGGSDSSGDGYEINKGKFEGSMFKVGGSHTLYLYGMQSGRLTLDGCANINNWGQYSAEESTIGNNPVSDNDRPGHIIELRDKGSLVMNHARLQRGWTNTDDAQSGGAILVKVETTTSSSRSTLTMTDCVIRGCYSERSASALTFREDAYCDATLTDVYFHHCYAKGDYPDSYGGTIRSYGGTKTKLTLRGCEIHHNRSGWHGGGIAWNGSGDGDGTSAGRLEITSYNGKNTIIRNNHADRFGGGIYVGGSATHINNCEIYENTAGMGGGGFAVQSYSGPRWEYGGRGPHIDLGSTVTIHHNTAQNSDGGGVLVVFRASEYTGYDEDYDPVSDNTSWVKINGSTIYKNNASRGGGVCVRDKYPKQYKSPFATLPTNEYVRYIEINSGEIYENTATSRGGGIAIIKYNNLDGSGYSSPEPFYQNNAGTLDVKLKGGKIYKNECTGANGGGGISIHDEFKNPGSENYHPGCTSICNVESSGNIQIYGNTSANNGGGVHLLYANLTMSNGTIGTSASPNYAYSGDGGGVYIKGGTFTKSGGSISYNHATRSGNNGGYGGGFYVTGDGAVTVGGTIGNNVADYNGGGFCVDGSSVVSISSGSNITYNTASNSGGGFSANGTVKVYGDSNISNNTATAGNGGGFWAGGTVDVYGGTISSNTASHGNGGGFYVTNNGNVTMSGTLKRNHAYGTSSDDNGRGGGFYVTGNGTVTLNGTIGGADGDGNTATFYGGGFGVVGGATLNLNGIVTYNSSQRGGGGYVSNSTANFNGGTHIDNNTASIRGGGFYTNDGAVAYVNSNASVSYNSVTTTDNDGGDGGGFCATNSSSVTVNGGSVSYNTAPDAGGGFYVTGGATVTVKGAVDHNTAGVGGGGYVANGNVNLQSGSNVHHNTATTENGGSGEGGGIKVYQGSLTYDSGDMSNNTAKDGGGLYVSAQGSVTYNNGNVKDNTASNNGGGIYMYGGSLSYTNGSISGNSATGNGGGIYATGGQTTLTGGTIGTNGSANTAQNGGGVYMAGGTLNHNGGSIGYNTATFNGGGLYINAGNIGIGGGTINNNGAVDGGGVYANNDFTLSSGTIRNNSASNNGGGIYIDADAVTCSGGTLSGNAATANGGGIYIASGETTLTGSTTIGGDTDALGNSATNGGGIYVNGGNLTYYGQEVSHNTATTNGGGIYMGGTTFDYLNGAILNNSATDGGGLYVASGTTTIASCNIGTSGNGNTASNNGGGVYLADGSLVYNNGNIQYNTATNDGGGIYVVGGSLNKKGTINNNTAQRNGGGLYAGGGAITLTSGYIRDNQAVDGGGVYVLNDDIVTYNGGTVTDNMASNDGGGIYFANQQTITLDEAINYTSNTAAANGGGVYMDGGSLTYDNGNVGKNQAANGGGIYVKSGTTTIQSGTLGGSGNGNTATSDGGGIYVDGGTITFTDGTVSHNTATANGGGVYMGGETFTYNNGSILKNEAAMGGGVYIASGATTITNCSIGASGNGNTAEYGGGVYLNAGSMDYKGGNIQYNTAIVDGGGIYAAGGTLNHHGGVTNNNNATHDGGGIYAAGGDVTLTNGYIRDNNATNDGGGIFVLNDNIVTYNGGTVSGNTASNDGGGIYFDNDQTITLDGLVSYLQNTATNNGGGVYMDGGTLTYDGGDVRKNQATNGGGIYVTSGATTIQGGTLGGLGNGNTATSDGGGIYVDGGSLTFNDGTVDNNLAHRNGGGIYLNGDTFTYSNGTVGNNTAVNNGGGIYVNTGTMNQTGGIVANNSASSSSVEVPETDLFEDFETGPEGGFTLEGWEFGGNAEWTFVEGGANQNSSFCIKSGAIDDSQQTDLSITFYLPENGTVSFWRKVSSQSNNDYLRFYVDNLQKGYWSGNVSWAKVEYELLAGRHTFRWTYVKNASNTSGNDCAWIDDIHFGYIPGYTLPVGSGDGGGLYVNNGEAVITGCNYSNNEAVNGGGIYTNGGATTFSGGTIGGLGNSNTATANGGGIYSNGGTTSLTKGTICFNEAVNGGGMYVNNGTVGCSNTISIVSNAASSHGGGIYTNGGTTTLTGGTVGTDGGANTAENGGGIYVNGGIVNQNGGDVTYNSASGSTITQEPEVEIFEDFETANFNKFGPDGWQNDPTYPWTIIADSPHAGSYCVKSGNLPSRYTTTGLSITMDIPVGGYISFYRKTSGATGVDSYGAYLRFYIDDEPIAAHDGERGWESFSYPVDAGTHTFKWTYYRGYWNNGSKCCWLDDIHFSTIPAGQPVTSGNGGGIYVNGGTLNQDGGTVTHNTVGGIAAAVVPEVNVNEDFETGDFSKFDYDFFGNTNWTIEEEGAHPGSSYCAKSGSIGGNQSTTLKVRIYVPASGTVSFYRKYSGAGNSRFYLNDAEKANWTGTSDWAQVSYPVSAGWNVFKWDHSIGWGGGSGFLWIDDIQYGPVIPSYTVTAGDGGGIYMLGGTFNQDGGTVAYNTAPNNGGGFFAEGGSATITDGIYSNNEATVGGGLYIHGGEVTISGGIVGGESEDFANSAQDGGGIAVGGGRLLREGGHLTYNGGTVLNNRAVKVGENGGNGGGFYAEGGESTIKGGTFGNNEANNGGGMYVKDGTVGCSGTFSVVSNTATTHGGGLYTEGGETTIAGGTIGNEAKASANTAVNGAGIYVEGGSLTYSSGSVIYNIASENGGGFYANGGATTIEGGTFGHNGAVDGGGMYVNDGTVDMSGGSVTYNNASNNGGGLYTNGGVTTVVNGTFDNNVASNNGGGIYLNDGTFGYNAGSVSYNQAMVDGGGMYVNGGVTTVNGGTFGSNEAINGAGIYANAELTVNGGTLQYNSASGDGGGIYIPDEVAVHLKGSTTLTGNHVPSAYNGGGIYMNGELYVGGGTNPFLKCKDNYASDVVLEPEEITKITRNNVYLPSRLKHITVRSDISGKTDGVYNTQIGITANVTIDDDKVPVVFVENVHNEPWLYNLMADIATAGGAVFDDKEHYIAIHTRRNVGEYNMQYIYFSQCWTTVVTSNPGEDHIKLIGDTYHIYTNQGLAWFSSLVNGLNLGDAAPLNTFDGPRPGLKAKMEADVDMRRFLWVPLGAINQYDASSSTFTQSDYTQSDSQGYTGEFDGQGYVIRGITNGYLTGITYYGLFGAVNAGGIVKNTLMDSYANLLVNSAVYQMGGIAGVCNGGTIYNCEARGAMDLTGSAATSNAGGVVGLLNAGQVHSCIAIPVFEGTNTTMGGLAGYTAAGTSVKNSYANNFIINNEDCSKASLVGSNNGRVDNCYSRMRRPELTDNRPHQNSENNRFYWFIHNQSYGATTNNCYAPEERMGFTDYNSVNYYAPGFNANSNYGKTALVDGKYGFAHCDQQIALQSGTYIGNGAINNEGDIGGLQSTLNNWVRAPENGWDEDLGKNTNGYSLWTRTMGSDINGDYPVLQFNDFVCVGSRDGIFMDYKPDVNTMISNYNADSLEFSDLNAVITDSLDFEGGPFIVNEQLRIGTWDWTLKDGTTITWTNEGTYPWEWYTNAHNGSHSIASSNPFIQNTTSSIIARTNFPYDCAFSFWDFCLALYLANTDYASFYIDGVEQFRRTDDNYWKYHRYIIPAGPHTLEWRYTDSYWQSGHESRYVVDDITFSKSIGVYDICLYDSNPSVLNTTTEERTSIYIKPNVCLLQEETSKDRLGVTINARVGIVLDNSSGDSDDPFMAYDWHMFSPALQAVPMGLKYPYIDFGDPSYNTNYNPEDYTGFVYVANSAPESSNYYHVADNFLDDDSYYADGIPQAVYRDAIKMDAPKPQWDTREGKIGYFPTDAPYGTWRGEPSPEGSYDFYCFDERSYHWINLKRNCFYYTEGSAKAQGDVTVYPDHWQEDSDEHGFHANIDYRNETEMIPGKGYLVAVSSPSMLMADGVLNNGTISRAVSAVAPDGYFTGTNLVGNPYQSYLDFDLFAADATNEAAGANTYYILDADAKGYLAYTLGATPQEEDWMSGVVGYTAGRYLHPHQGFFIKVNDEAEEVRFTNAMRSVSVQAPFRSQQSYPLVNLICTDEGGRNDFATVELARPETGGGKKAKGLRTGDASLWIHLTDNEDYHIAFAPLGTKAVPVHFKAYADGVYTLNWNIHNADFNYIHLIDNLTGADVDCLAEEQYIFEGKPSDYKSRFMLVFDFEGNEAPEVPEEPEDPEPVEGPTSFAFQMGGQLIVNGEGTLQMFDVQGRCLLEKGMVGAQSAVSLPMVADGVYTLRLINGKNVKVQKMVINKWKQ